MFFAILLGFFLSAGVEITQVYTPARNTSLLDVTTNTAGSAAGALLSIAFAYTIGATWRKLIDPAALAITALWVVSLVFPFVPVSSSVLLADKIALFWIVSPVAFVSSVVGWYIAGHLLIEAGVRNATTWLYASTLLVPLQILIVPRQSNAAMLAGALVGAALFTLFRRREDAKFVAAAALLVLLLRGAAPFILASEPNSFAWMPFAAFIESNWQRTGYVLVEKFYYCTTAVWAVRRIGLRLSTAVFGVAAVLALIEALQVWLPGRSPAIDDPMLAFLSGSMLDALSRQPQTNFQPLRNFGRR
jgi:VanZ family protein